jgi:hypothetical protein
MHWRETARNSDLTTPLWLFGLLLFVITDFANLFAFPAVFADTKHMMKRLYAALLSMGTMALLLICGLGTIYLAVRTFLGFLR